MTLRDDGSKRPAAPMTEVTAAEYGLYKIAKEALVAVEQPRYK